MSLVNYYFISLPEPAMDAILEHAVTGGLENQAKFWDGSYLIKVEGELPTVFNSHTAYNHSEMKTEKAIREQGRSEL